MSEQRKLRIRAATLEDGTLLERGDMLPESMSAEEVARYDENGWLEPVEGDYVAPTIVATRPSDVSIGGGPVNDQPDVLNTSTADLADWIKESGVTAPQLVEMAEGDPEKAQAIIDAEQQASDQDGRRTVVGPLQHMVDRSK
jgi:hypothetical protein